MGSPVRDPPWRTTSRSADCNKWSASLRRLGVGEVQPRRLGGTHGGEGPDTPDHDGCHISQDATRVPGKATGRFEGRCSAQEEEFQAKLQEQERRLEGRCSAQEEEFQAKLQEQERRFEELQKELEVGKSSHMQELQEQEKKFKEKFQEQEKRFEKQEQNFREMVEKLEKKSYLKISKKLG